jgi:hypothetical protein
MCGGASADVGWRPGPQGAWFLSVQLGAIGLHQSRIRPLAAPATYLGSELDEVDFGSAVIGLERSRGRTTSGTYAHAGVGAGRIWRNSSTRAETGAALDAGAGWRISPPPGPVGFTVAVKTHHVIAAHMRAHMLTFGLGLTIWPR